jgi:putative ABC transport system substrate-binding protein
MLIVILALGLLAAPPPAGGPSAARIARIGALSLSSPPSEVARQRSPFRQALRELGWVEGKNIVFEGRYAEGDQDRLPTSGGERRRAEAGSLIAFGYSRRDKVG